MHGHSSSAWRVFRKNANGGWKPLYCCENGPTLNPSNWFPERKMQFPIRQAGAPDNRPHRVRRVLRAGSVARQTCFLADECSYRALFVDRRRQVVSYFGEKGGRQPFLEDLNVDNPLVSPMRPRRASVDLSI